MCGFAGEYLLDDATEVSESALGRRASFMQHRGPDAVGTWCNRHVGFAHVRLTLLDAENGQQPMHSPRGTVVSYNGEIYNADELRTELAVHGYPFEGRSDTEVVLAAYEIWGDAAWKRLNGMFAFALYDPQREKLLLVRDRFGIKPVFYRLTNRGLEFGSEPSSWEHVHNGYAPQNLFGILHYLRFAQPVFGNRSVFADLKVLEPGTQLVIGADGATVERWHTPGGPDVVVSTDREAVIRARLRHLMHLAVSRQMVADAPVGVFLSGGVDSAILVGLLAQVRPEPPRTYTIALEGDEDEFAPAAAVVKRWRCRHTQLRISPADFFNGMHELMRLRHMPAAYPNEILIWLLAKEAVADVKAVLTGEGADELFGGYTRILAAIDSYANARNAARAGNPLLLNLLRAEKPNLDTSSDSRYFAGIYSWFQSAELAKLLNRRWRDALHLFDDEDPFAGIINTLSGNNPENRFHLMLEYAHLPNLLARLDGATMGASLEGRVPYTDNDLVEYVTSLPADQKFNLRGPDKPLLRKTFDDIVPPEVLNRPKKPFDASLDRLFQSPEGQRELAQICADGPMLEIFDRNALRMWLDDNRKSGQGLKVWLLLSLRMWLNRNIL
jgi:asparagine synthase (glutamine-hydrolysing)